MADTTHLILPLLAAAQAQKHVTHNEALLRLDALVQMSAIDRDLTDPPADPSDGDRYIPASGATGAWDDWDLNIAWYVDGVWTKLVPREGWRVWVEDEDVLLVWDGAAWQQIEGGGGGGSTGHNLLVNGGFAIAQRGTAFTAASEPANDDDCYLIDQWVLLSDGNGVVDVSQHTAEPPDGSPFALELAVAAASKKFGVLQIIEHAAAKAILGGTASLSFKAKVAAGNAKLDKLRAAIVTWTGTADSPTSDVVSAWNGEGADPALAADWSYENAPADLPLTSGWQTFRIENVAIDTANGANVAVFIWCDNADAAVGDLLHVADVKLEAGPTATTFVPPDLSQEFVRCQRYFLRIAGSASVASRLMVGQVSTPVDGRASFFISVAAPMRDIPSASASGLTTHNVTDATDAVVSVNALFASGTGIGFGTQIDGSYSSTFGEMILARFNAGGRLDFSAEL